MSLFAPARPRWYAIPAHRPFLDDLARGLADELLARGGPEALADALVLVPTRRGARALADAFVRAGEGRALLLPQIRALGDLDEGEPPFEPGDLALDLPPAIEPLQRRFELARLVASQGALFGREPDAADALRWGDALAAFLDSAEIEETTASFDRLATLVEGDLARHWRVSAEVLQTAAQAWPARLAELGLIDVAERRTRLLRRLGEQWRARPPERPLIAAGSTGTAPATADLLAAIAEAPRGAVVLPGLDPDLADEAWAEVSWAHPQGALKRLLDGARIARGEVRTWPASESGAARRAGRARRRVVNEALRPAEKTGDWRDQIAKLRAEAGPGDPDPIRLGLEGLAHVSARSEDEAATVAALALREALETPGKTAALVTPDPVLARRVAAKLARFGLQADSSAGAPLAGFPVGRLLHLAALAAGDPLSPVEMLALLKHPLTRLGWERDALRDARRTLERHGLRGPRPHDLDGLRLRLAPEPDRDREPAPPEQVAARAAAADLAAAHLRALEPLRAAFASGACDAGRAARALAETVEGYARDAAGDTGELWGGAGGEAAAELVARLMAHGGALPPTTVSGFSELIQALTAETLVRTGGATHPRLAILGAIEARLVRADRLVLAGLEEGVWPRLPATDPFLSRPMREALGLPPPERRLGLSAHDFAQAACAPEVLLVSAERRGGQPAVKSRWLWRLQILAAGAEVEIPSRPELLDWARALDAPLADPPPALRPAARPEPRPPLAARPRRLSVTQVETWTRDPYAIYARHILRLSPLDAPDAPVEAGPRGTAIHVAMERLVSDHPELPPDAEARFEALLLEELVKVGVRRPALARETAYARRLAPWVIGWERQRRPDARILVEQQGALHLGEIDFTLTARADRLELKDGLAHVIDFKTGAPPTAKQVKAHFAPQLTLTAAILQGGGFAALGPVGAGELLYVQLTGREIAGRVVPALGAEEDAQTIVAAALAGLKQKVAEFDDPTSPYISWSAPQHAKSWGGDYDHLARRFEWHVMGGSGAEGGA